MDNISPYLKLKKIDVSRHLEKKDKKDSLSYLSWVWAVDYLLQADSNANWEFHEPRVFNDTMMVSCSVTAFGKTMTCHLPVIDSNFKAIKYPDSFSVNTSMQRCLVKCIALHGLGLSVYAGEDLKDSITEYDDQRDSHSLYNLNNNVHENTSAFRPSFKTPTQKKEFIPSGFSCSVAGCKKELSEKAASFSISKFKRHLCFDHQKEID